MGVLGVYCTVSLSWDLARGQNPLEYLKQWDLGEVLVTPWGWES